MESSLLSTFRPEEENFASMDYGEIHSYADQTTSIGDQIVHLSNSESAEENYERTLSDWQTYVGSVPIMDSDYSDSDRINCNLDLLDCNSIRSMPSKSRKNIVSVNLQNGNNQAHNFNHNASNHGDNRLINNDNTSEHNMIPDVISPLESSSTLLDNFDSKFLEDDNLNNLLECSELSQDINKLQDIDQSRCNDRREVNMKIKLSPVSQIQRKYALSSRNKRKKQKSLSLPQSPDHEAFDVSVPSLDMQGSFCFEDIDLVDIETFVNSDLNLSSEKDFNRSFDISALEDCNDDMMKKSSDVSIDMFNSGVYKEFDKVCDLESNIKDFDLPSFIMGKDSEDSNILFADCLEPIPKNGQNLNKPDNKVIDNTTVQNILPNNSQWKQDIKSKALDTVVFKTRKPIIKTTKNLSLVKKQLSLYESKNDTDDYVDVESVSDDESVPVIATNSSKSILPKKLLHPVEYNNNTLKRPKNNLKIPKTELSKSAIKKNSAFHVAPNHEDMKISHSHSHDQQHIIDHDYCFPYKDMKPKSCEYSRDAYKMKQNYDSEMNENLNSQKMDPKSKKNINDGFTDRKISDYLRTCKSSSLKEKKKLEINKTSSNLNQYLPSENVVKLEMTNERSINISNSNINSSNTTLHTSDSSRSSDKLVTDNEDEWKRITIKCEKELSRPKKVIGMNRNIGNVLTVSNTFNCDFKKNSLLITNLKTQCDEKKPLPKINENIKVSKNNLNRKEYSLLKPFLKDNVKMVSLLKTNYSNEADTSNIHNGKVIQSDKKASSVLNNKSLKKCLTKKLANIETVKSSDIDLANLNKVNPKRRLNIEEYKKRIEGGNSSCDNSRTCSPVNIMNNEQLSTTIKNVTNNDINNKNQLNTIKSEKNLQDHPKIFDPIADASRKVALRMKKKSSRILNEDKIIKSKIANVENFVILPLATENGKLLPMIKTKAEKEVETIANVPIMHLESKDYDEVTTVCVGTNTDIDGDKYSIFSKANNQIKNIHHEHPVLALNGNSDVKDSFQDNVKQVYVRENKTIMYLKKDRIEPEKQSVHVQTDPKDLIFETKAVTEKKRRERRDSSMSISGESNCDQTHADLIKRWKSDVIQKSDMERGSNSSVKSSSLLSGRSRKLTSKHRAHDDQSSDSSYTSLKYKRRSRSCSRSKKRNRHKYCSYDLKHGSSDLSRMNFKRKRNLSISEDENEISDQKHSIKTIKNYDSDDDDIRKSRRSYVSDSSHSSCSSSQSDSDSGSSVSSRSSSAASYRSLSSKYKNKSRSKSRNRFRSRSRSRSSENGRYRRRSTQKRRTRTDELYEERKVIYVGMLEPSMTNTSLKSKFLKYGCVENVTIHRKTDGMRYGFVTFSHAESSYKAKDNAPSDPEIRHYDVFFGARRAFCKQYYADLDDSGTMEKKFDSHPATVERSSFEHLLQEVKKAVYAKKARAKDDLSDKNRKKI